MRCFPGVFFSHCSSWVRGMKLFPERSVFVADVLQTLGKNVNPVDFYFFRFGKFLCEKENPAVKQTLRFYKRHN